MTAARSALPSALAGWAAGALASADLHAAFEAATVLVQRVPGAEGRPAVAAVGPRGAGFVAMYSSPAAVAAAVGDCDWASATGFDLLALVPPGYGVVLDRAGPHPAVLAADAIRRGVVISRAAS